MAVATQVCAALVATKDRSPTLLCRALNSIRRQSSIPVMVVLVNDGQHFSRSTIDSFHTVLSPIALTVLTNRYAPGAAGAWNTGLEAIEQYVGDGFVAMLDDDDEWDPCHLEENLAASGRHQASLVVSGLRLVNDGVNIERALPEGLTPRDFLIGNPGWQGSNTFVTFSLIRQVRGFRNGLPSLNDRDLAIRLLRVPGVRPAYTGKWTCSWHISPDGISLSTPRSAAKISGLRWFWRIYGHEMTRTEAEAFFDRANRLFAVERETIIDAGDDVPPHLEPRGDLRVNLE